MNRWRIGTGMLGLLLCSASPLEASDAILGKPLGRLFHSPQARADLDEARRNKEPPSRRMPAGRITIDGIVRRGKGPATVWINGHIAEDGLLITQAGTNSIRLDPGDGEVHELKVGESIELAPTRRTP